MNDSYRRRNGHTRAVAFDGACYILPLDTYESFRAHWRKGEAFWSGVDFWGALIDIKLSRIEAVVQATPEALAGSAADDAAEKAEAMIRGDDG